MAFNAALKRKSYKKFHLKKTDHDKLNLKQRIIRYFIEPACGTIERDEFKTRGEPVVGVAFKQEWREAAKLIVALLPERTVSGCSDLQKCIFNMGSLCTRKLPLTLSFMREQSIK